MESRLEAFRARAEEASVGTNGDVHAKLLRQIETLQNQYAIASENWQGIEGSLLTRITALERERDEIAKRESDIRRKAREAVSSFFTIIYNFLWQSKQHREAPDPGDRLGPLANITPKQRLPNPAGLKKNLKRP